MALAFTLLTADASAAAGTSRTTASISVSAGDLIIVDVWNDNVSSGTSVPPTGISGAGLTFALVDDVAGDANYLNLSRWRAEASSGSSGALTISYSVSQNEVLWAVTQVTGHASGSNGANAFNTNKSEVGNAGSGSTHSTTISALASASNACLCSFAWENFSATVVTGTAGNSFSELADVGVIGNGSYAEGLCVMYRVNATDPAVTWSAYVGNRSALAHEVIAGAGGTPVGLASETDTALALSSPPAVGRAVETDTALPLDGVNFAQDGDLFLFGDDSGNESSMGGLRLFGGFIASSSSGDTGLASETDTAVSRGSARPAGVCTETDQALALLPASNGAVGRADETDAAISLGAARPVGLAAETELALAPAGAAVRAVGRSDESDVALALLARQLQAVGVSTESDAALALNSAGGAVVGLAAETNFAVARGASRPAAVAIEGNAAIALAPVQLRSVGVAAELDAAVSLGGSAGTYVGVAVETDAAVPRGSARPAGVAVEAEAALGLAKVLIRQAGIAAEADVALALAGLQRRDAGLAAETDSAQRLFSPGAQAVGLASELDVSLALQLVLIPPARRSRDKVRRQLARTVPATTRRPTT